MRPAVDDGRHVADLLDLVEQVGRQEHGAALADHLAHERPELGDAGGVEAVGRLVQDHQRRVGQQAAGDPEPLPHAHRVRLDPVVGPVGQPDALERARDPGVGLGSRQAAAMRRFSRAGEVAVKAGLLDDRPDPCERLGAAGGHRQPEQVHLAGGGVRQPEQRPDQRGLARAVRTQEPEGDAVGHGQVGLGKRQPLAEPLGQARWSRSRATRFADHGAHSGVQGSRGDAAVARPRPNRIPILAACGSTSCRSTCRTPPGSA